jgi:putative membrane protein
MINHLTHETQLFVFQFLVILIGITALFMYFKAVHISNKKHKTWPVSRVFLWVFGILTLEVALVGPLASRAHTDFTAHMVGHLLLGMLSPLLLVLSAPMTLVLRTLSVQYARQLTSIVKSSPIQFLSNPLVASILNVGGLWVLYTTKLYGMMHHHVYIHVLIHLHVFLAGYFFTFSMISIDPTSHRTRFRYRAVVLLLALTAHGILSKYIFAYPPNGVPKSQAELGGMLMYYGGDLIDLILIIVFCSQWYKASRPRQQRINLTKGGGIQERRS